MQSEEEVNFNEASLEITENKEIDQTSCKSNEHLENIIMSEGSFDEVVKSNSNNAQGLFMIFMILLFIF